MNATVGEQEAADRIGRSPRTLRNWRYLGIGPRYVKYRGRVRYRVEDLATFEAAHLVIPFEEASG